MSDLQIDGYVFKDIGDVNIFMGRRVFKAKETLIKILKEFDSYEGMVGTNELRDDLDDAKHYSVVQSELEVEIEYFLKHRKQDDKLFFITNNIDAIKHALKICPELGVKLSLYRFDISVRDTNKGDTIITCFTHERAFNLIEADIEIR